MYAYNIMSGIYIPIICVMTEYEKNGHTKLKNNVYASVPGRIMCTHFKHNLELRWFAARGIKIFPLACV